MRLVLRPLALLALAASILVVAGAVSAQAAPAAHATAACTPGSLARAQKAVRAAKRARARVRRARGLTRARRARARRRAARRLARARRRLAVARRCSRRQAQPAPPAAATQAPAFDYAWNFEGAGGAGCAAKGLSCPGLENWDFPQWPEMHQGQTRAVRPQEYEVPPRPGSDGDHVLRASVNEAQRDGTAAGLPSGYKAYAAYLYKVWAVAAPETGWQSDLTNRPLERMTRGQEAGTYRAWYYLPSSTKTTLQSNNDATHGWVNIFQFKHSSPDMAGPGHWDQPPEWWVNIRNNDPNHLSLVVSHSGDPAYGERNGVNSPHLPAVPFDRWFELRADLHPNNRVEFYLDGQLFDTGHQADHQVGLAAGDSSWVFSPGWYLNTGTAYIDDVSFDRKPADW
jgi:hypothetical protein